MDYTLYWHYIEYECPKFFQFWMITPGSSIKSKFCNENRIVGSQTNCSPLIQNFRFGNLDMDLLKLLSSYYIEETENSLQVNPASLRKSGKEFRLDIRESDSVTIAISAIRSIGT
jgi:hypothetical protein